MTENIAFHDLPPEAFPFTVEFISEASDRVVHEVTVDGPGALAVPGQQQLKEPCRVRIVFATGEVVEST